MLRYLLTYYFSLDPTEHLWYWMFCYESLNCSELIGFIGFVWIRKADVVHLDSVCSRLMRWSWSGQVLMHGAVLQNDLEQIQCLGLVSTHGAGLWRQFDLNHIEQILVPILIRFVYSSMRRTQLFTYNMYWTHSWCLYIVYCIYMWPFVLKTQFVMPKNASWILFCYYRFYELQSDHACIACVYALHACMHCCMHACIPCTHELHAYVLYLYYHCCVFCYRLFIFSTEQFLKKVR